MNGDLLDTGFDPETSPANLAAFFADYGLTGHDGLLCYPLYEGFGNHDGGPTRSFVRQAIKERNPHRSGLAAISHNGLHYSWDWENVHFVNLNLFGGSGAADVKGVNGPEHDPENALEFLVEDLAKCVAASNRPIVIFQHFAWTGGMSDWWKPEAKDRFYDAVKNYRVAALINGHSHGAAFAPWKGLLSIHDGATSRPDGDSGDFLVIRITDAGMTIIQRKLGGTWGMSGRFKVGALN
jgi:cytolysin (calcineurin-like family phosphatase)